MLYLQDLFFYNKPLPNLYTSSTKKGGKVSQLQLFKKETATRREAVFRRSRSQPTATRKTANNNVAGLFWKVSSEISSPYFSMKVADYYLHLKVTSFKPLLAYQQVTTTYKNTKMFFCPILQ